MTNAATMEDLRLDGGVAPPSGDRNLIGMLDRAAAAAPDRPFLRQRLEGEWRELRFRDARDRAKAVGRALTAHGLAADRPLAILSGNSLDHALMALGAAAGNIPAAPISSAYATSADLGRLRSVLEALTPGLVYADQGEPFSAALTMARDMGLAIATAKAERPGDLSLEGLQAEGATAPAVEPGGPEAVAKILFTSGSTGSPKGVIITNAMFCSNQAALAEAWRDIDHDTPMVVDWLPWSHVYGGGLVFNYVLSRAGTLVIDEGRPLPGQFGPTIANLAEHRPTFHFGVPRGFAELAPVLAADEALARAYFSRLRGVLTAGAAISRDCWKTLHDLARRFGRDDLRIMIAWGSTETAPVVSVTRPGEDRPDALGAPIPGAEIKLLPTADTWEVRVRGPMVTPGYWRRPDLTREMFDEEGFYRIGDAGRLIDPADPGRGVAFDGRIAENFKLSTGTWVSAGAVRVGMIAAAAPLIRDVVVAGADRDFVGLLVFPNVEACGELADPDAASEAEIMAHPAVRSQVQAAMRRFGAEGGSALRVRRALILTDPPSPETGEITDKGYLNQALILRRRSEAVARLYADPPAADVILAGD